MGIMDIGKDALDFRKTPHVTLAVLHSVDLDFCNVQADDVGSFLFEILCDRFADALCGTGDYYRFVRKHKLHLLVT